MSKKSAVKPDDPAQYKRFVEAARKAEADETEKGADKAFKKVISGSRRSADQQPKRQQARKAKT